MAAKTETLNFTPEQSAKLAAWKAAQTQMEQLKKQELQLRNELVDALLPIDKVEGSQTFDIGNGWKLTMERGFNYNVDTTSAERLLDLLPPQIGEKLFSWKPSLSMKAYKDILPAYRAALPADKQSALAEALVAAVTVKPSTPTMKLTEPKGN